MFTIDNDITDLKIREKKLFKVFFSMNIHQVATPETSLEDARSYVFFFHEGRDRISAYIGLYFLHTDRKLFYAHSGNPFSEKGMPDVDEEARNFAEDLGAMLDELDFARMPDSEQDQWINEQEILSGKKKDVESPEDSVPAADAPVMQSEAATQINAVEQQVSAAQPAQVQPQPVQYQPVQPAAVVQPETSAAQPQPIPASQQQPQPQAVSSPEATPAQPAPLQQAQQPSRSQRKPAVPQQTATVQSSPSVSGTATEQPVPVQRVDDVLEQAVKAGVVKAPKPQLKKDIHNANGVVSRDKEALARLLASF